MMSLKVTLSRFCFRKSTRRSKWLASASAMAELLSSHPHEAGCPSYPSAIFSLCGRYTLLGEHRLDLGLERLCVERLDDVVVHAGLLRRDHVLGLGLGRHHDERRLV